MIVLDACVVIEVLLRTPLGRRLEDRIFGDDEVVHVPQLADIEVLQVLRSLILAKELTVPQAEACLARLREWDLVRHPHEDLRDRVFALRHNLTAYDAVYLALTESLDATLVTSDRVFGKVPGHRARVEHWK